MQEALRSVDALLGLEAEREIDRLSEDPAPPPVESEDPAFRERLEDQLAPDRVTEAHHEAAAALGRASSEDRRRALRALAPSFLARSAREPEAELAGRRAGHEVPPIGFEAALACEASPDERDSLFARWIALERDLAPARIWRAEAREAAARRAGAASVCELLGASHPVAARDLLDPFERVVIAPLDEAVERAVAALGRHHGRGHGSRLPADAPRVQHLMGHARWLARDEIAGAVRWLASEDGPAGAARVDVATAAAAGAGAAWKLTRAGRAWVGVGACGGPAALRAALAALGRAARGGFLAATRGTFLTRFADAAFDQAAGVLFGRLALCARFLERARIPENAAARDELALHEAVATRVAWVYLQSVLANVDAEDSAFDRSVERATGGPVTPAHREEIRDRDPAAAAALRGTVLGLLLEERLRLRFGRGWFVSTRAKSWLQSVWEAEPDHTAEELAAAAELGGIEPTPVLDASRAALGEGSGSGR